MDIRGICFDMDGVLTDTETLGGRMLNLACLRQGFEMPDSMWTSIIGTTMEYTCAYIRSYYPHFDSEQFREDWSEITFKYVDQYGVPVKQGADELLHRLNELGYKTALCTNNIPAVVHKYLHILQWDSCFDAILTSRDVQHRKPNPETYLCACHLMNLSQKACIGIEDSPSGVKAVHDAGMFCIHIPDLITLPPEYTQFVDMFLPSLHEVLPLIKFL